MLNNVLNNINTRTTYIRRKDVGTPIFENHANQSIFPSNNVETNKKKSTSTSHMKRYTPKRMRKHTNKKNHHPKYNTKRYTPKRRV